MPRKPKSPNRLCQCDTCLKDGPQGLLIPAHTFSIHHRQQLIRNALGAANAVPSDPTSTHDSDIDMTDNWNEEDAPSAETASDVRQDTTRSDADDLLSIEEDIDAQLATLASELTLEFLYNPSPDTPFQYPDPTALGIFNSGPFCLKTNKLCNRRFLEIESHICGLRQQMEQLPPEERSEKLEDSIYHALVTIQRLKNKHWSDQAYPNTLGSFNNRMCLFLDWSVY